MLRIALFTGRFLKNRPRKTDDPFRLTPFVNPWIETVGVIALAGAAAVAARRLSDMPRPYWTATYALSAAILIMMWLGRSYSALSLVPPVSWIAAGRTKFALVAVVPVIMLVPLFHSTRSRRVQFYGTIFLCLLVGLYAIWPFAACATNRGYLNSMPTRFDRYGVCLQSTDYTCGPAAAVTALRLLGIRGEEGKIAIASHTSSAIGTPPAMLCEGLRSLYFTNALKCELQYFERLSDLPKGAPILAVIKYTIVEDHYVVILDITPRHVIVADSNRGKVAYSHELFLKRWRKLGIVMSRTERV